MSEATALEKQVEALVSVAAKEPGGPTFVELRTASKSFVHLGPYENPATAREDASHIKKFLVAVLRETKTT